eukprot:UN01043
MRRVIAASKAVILEGFRQVCFPDNTRLFVYPEINQSGELCDHTSVKVSKNLEHLFQHLLANNWLYGIETSDVELFKIFSRNVLKQLPKGRGEWKSACLKGSPKKLYERSLLVTRN